MAIHEQLIDYGDGDTACKGFLAYDDSRPGPRTMHAFSDPRASNAAFGLMYNPDAERRAAVSLLNFFEEVLR